MPQFVFCVYVFLSNDSILGFLTVKFYTTLYVVTLIRLFCLFHITWESCLNPSSVVVCMPVHMFAGFVIHFDDYQLDLYTAGFLFSTKMCCRVSNVLRFFFYSIKLLFTLTNRCLQIHLTCPNVMLSLFLFRSHLDGSAHI